jgi:hypothetical protein
MGFHHLRLHEGRLIVKSFRYLIAVIALLISGSAAADITVGVSTTGSVAGTSITTSFTPGTLTNGMIEATLVIRTANSVVTNVKWDGVAMTEAHKQNGGNSNAATVRHYYIQNPTTGTKNFTASFSPSSSVSVYLSSWNGVEQSGSPVDVSTGTNVSASNPSVSATVTSTGCVLIDGLMHEGSAASTKEAAQTYHSGSPIDEGTWNSGASYKISASSGSLTMSWTNGASDTLAYSWVAYKAAVSAGGGGSRRVISIQ